MRDAGCRLRGVLVVLTGVLWSCANATKKRMEIEIERHERRQKAQAATIKGNNRQWTKNNANVGTVVQSIVSLPCHV